MLDELVKISISTACGDLADRSWFVARAATREEAWHGKQNLGSDEGEVEKSWQRLTSTTGATPRRLFTNLTPPSYMILWTQMRPPRCFKPSIDRCMLQVSSSLHDGATIKEWLNIDMWELLHW